MQCEGQGGAGAQVWLTVVETLMCSTLREIAQKAALDYERRCAPAPHLSLHMPRHTVEAPPQPPDDPVRVLALVTGHGGSG